MDKGNLEKTLNQILDNTKTIPDMKENLTEIKTSLKISQERLNGLCNRVDKIQDQCAHLTERVTVQETVCEAFREGQSAIIPLETAKVRGSYQLRNQWIVLLAAILVATITLLGQWCGPII